MSSYDGSARDYFRKNLIPAKFGMSLMFEQVGVRKQENGNKDTYDDDAIRNVSIIQGKMKIGVSLCEHFTDLQEQIHKEYNQNFDMSKGIPFLFNYINELGEQIEENLSDMHDFCKVNTQIHVIKTFGEIRKHYENYLDMRIHDEYYKIHQKKSELICKEFGMGDDAYCEFVKYLRPGKAFPDKAPHHEKNIDFQEAYDVKGAFKNNCYDFGEYNPYKVIQ